MTTTGYGITGIGYPMYGLGDYGLSTNSAYGTYDNYLLMYEEDYQKGIKL